MTQHPDCWNHMAARSPLIELEHCDMCSEPHPADPDIEAITGRWLCVPCIEATLEGAVHERDV